MADRRPRIGWPERRDGAIAGLFFGAIAVVIYLVLSLIVGLFGWWRDTAATFGKFMIAQMAYALVIILGIAVIGAFWDLRRSRIGSFVLWLGGGLLVSGGMISLLRGPLWTWGATNWGWLSIMAPAFAWVFASGKPKQ